MKIIIRTKNIDLTSELSDFIGKKVRGLKKFIKILKDFEEVFVEVEKETKHHRKGDIFKAEATIHLPGNSLIVKSHGDNLNKVIIAIRDELEREIRKYKTKTIELPRRKYRKLKREKF